MKQPILIGLILMCSFSLSAQVSITGKVLDDEEKPLEYAAIRLFKMADSTVASGIYTSVDGSFVLAQIKPGVYFLVTTFTNYQADTIHSVQVKSEDFTLEPIRLSINPALELDEVIAVGNLDVLKAGIDKKIYDVGNDLSTRGGTVNDVLNNIPSIDVDQDGNISLRGDGKVTVLIDGRPSGLVLGDGQNLLGSLPANSIERVEVVTNPSAKYDPDGTAGIINIVMKKNKLRGFNGVISATAGTGNQYEGNLALSVRNQHLNSYVNYSYNYFEGYRNYNSDLTREINADSSNHLTQFREGTDENNSNTVVIGSDFFIKENHVIGISGTGSLSQRERTGDLRNTLTDGNDELIRLWNRTSRDPNSSRNLDLNANYKRTFKDSKGDWTTAITRSMSDETNEGFYEENYFQTYGVPSSLSPLNQQLKNTEKTSVTSFQSDYTYIFKPINGRLEAGAKAIVNEEAIETNSLRRDTVTGEYNPDTLANFSYSYFGSVYSLYGIFGQELGKFKYQAGLRGEYAEQVPKLLSSGEDFTTTYLNLFPSAHLKYEFSKKTEVGLSYSRRINRPGSRQLNPFTNYSDPFNLRSGNPELKPEFIHSFDASFSYTKNKLIFTSSAYFRQTTGVINRVRIFRDDNTAVVTFENIDESKSTGLELIFIYKPNSWMKHTLSLNGIYIDYSNNSTTSDWNNDGFYGGAKYVGSIDFWKNSASFQINANYQTPRVTPQGVVLPRGNMDLALEKRLLNKQLSIGLRVTDVFNTKGFRTNLTQVGVVSLGEYKWLTRRVLLSATYKFGKYEAKLPKNGGGDNGGME